MIQKEAKARIKINKLLQEAGWRFFDNESGPVNIVLENNVKLTKQTVDERLENVFRQLLDLYERHAQERQLIIKEKERNG